MDSQAIKRLTTWGFLLLVIPGVTQAQFSYTTNDGGITITGYTGAGGAVTIPSATNGLPVTTIGELAFYKVWSLTDVTIPDSVLSIERDAFAACTNLTSVVIPDSVTSIGSGAFGGTSLTSVSISNGNTSIGAWAFAACTSLTSVTIGDGNTSLGAEAFAWSTGLTSLTKGNGDTTIGFYAFMGCTNLTSLTIGNGVTSIGVDAFSGTGLTSVRIGNGNVSIGNGAFLVCTSLTNVTIGDGHTSLGVWAFMDCSNLAGIYFQGDAPSLAAFAFLNTPATVYYLPGTTGWDTTLGGRPTALWFLPNPLILRNSPHFGVQSNGSGFIISWATNGPVVVEASTDLGNWISLATNMLSGGCSYFSDPQWTNYPARFYRLRWP